MGRTVSSRRLRFAGAFLSTLALLLQGCYETLPLQQGPPPSTVSVQLVLNDKGRLAVSDKLGSAVEKVEGTITAQNSDTYTLAVSEVFQMGGISSKWNGEPVTIAKDGTVGYQIHRFNQTRTVILAVVLVAAAVAFLVTAGLNGGGTAPPSGNTGNTGQTH
jgi:hypothetical protein